MPALGGRLRFVVLQTAEPTAARGLGEALAGIPAGAELVLVIPDRREHLQPAAVVGPVADRLAQLGRIVVEASDAEVIRRWLAAIRAACPPGAASNAA